MFENINQAQYLWYQAQLAIDDEEKFKLLREVAEHNALFWNSEGVEEVRKARENTFETPDNKFGEMVEDMFGRPLPDKDGVQSNSNILDPYLNMDLDEIKFTPL
jgi:hypothetical protein